MKTLSLAAFSFLALAFQPADPEAKILTYKQYAKLRHGVPYVLEFKVGSGALLMYGSRHVFDPADALIADIEKEWKAFKPTAAFNEGGDPPSEKELKTAVERWGEAGLVRHLAARDEVEVATFEPKDVDEVAYLRKKHGAEQVKVFYVLRAHLTFRKTKHEETTEAFITRVLDEARWKRLGVDSGPRDLKELDAACGRLFKGLKDWREIPESYFDPTKDGQFTNDLANESGWFRDRHIFKLLVARAQKGERVFAVIGASHVPVQEPALKAALGAPARKRDGMKAKP